MTGWFRGLVPVCHADLTGHRGPVAGLGFGVPGNPGAALSSCRRQGLQFTSGALG